MNKKRKRIYLIGAISALFLFSFFVYKSVQGSNTAVPSMWSSVVQIARKSLSVNAAGSVTWVEPIIPNTSSTNPLLLGPAGTTLDVKFNVTGVPAGYTAHLYALAVPTDIASFTISSTNSQTFSTTWDTTGRTNGMIYRLHIEIHPPAGTSYDTSSISKPPWIYVKVGGLTSLTAPRSLTATVNTDEARAGRLQIDVSWLPTSTQHIGYIIERSDNGGTFREIGRLVDSSPSDQVTRRIFVDRGPSGSPPTPSLGWNTRYSYQIKAYNGSIISPASSAVTVTTPVSTAPITNNCGNVTIPEVILLADSYCPSTSVKAEYRKPGIVVLPSSINNQTSAVRINRVGWSVRVYDADNFQGVSKCLTHHYDDLSSPTDTFEDGSNMNNRYSSIEIFDNAACVSDIKIYERTSYNSNGTINGAGVYKLTNNICDTRATASRFDNGVLLHQASSISIPSGKTVELYTGHYFSGEVRVLSSSRPDFNYLSGATPQFNDHVRSIKITGGTDTCATPPRIACDPLTSPASEAATSVWIDDANDLTAAGRNPNYVKDTDAWHWRVDNPPMSRTQAHQSMANDGLHQHYVTLAADKHIPVYSADKFYTYICIDPAEPPRELMMQFRDETGSWEHRAYWGENLINWGSNGTVARKYKGVMPQPPHGKWVKLEITTDEVDMAGKKVSGVAYTLYGGRVAWDKTGLITSSLDIDIVDFENTIPYNSAVLLDAKTRSPLALDQYEYFQFYYKNPSNLNNFIARIPKTMVVRESNYRSARANWNANTLPSSAGYKVYVIGYRADGSHNKSPELDLTIGSPLDYVYDEAYRVPSFPSPTAIATYPTVKFTNPPQTNMKFKVGSNFYAQVNTGVKVSRVHMKIRKYEVVEAEPLYLTNPIDSTYTNWKQFINTENKTPGIYQLTATACVNQLASSCRSAIIQIIIEAP